MIDTEKKIMEIKSARRWNCNMYAEAMESIINGATLKDVGEMFGVGPERMRQVFSKASRMMRHPSMQDEGVPYPLGSDIKAFRKNSVFWLGQCNKLREKRYMGIGHKELNSN